VHLHQAIRWDPRNVQAMRLLALVYLARGRAEYRVWRLRAVANH